MTTADICAIETLLDEHPRLAADPVTPRFCSYRLSGLFKEKHHIPIHQLGRPIPGKSNRRCLIICGNDLFSRRNEIGDLIDRAIQTDPFTLWQFVLEPQQEEPLDLLDYLVEIIQKQPTQLLDRFASAAAFKLIVSRRLYVRLPHSASHEWRDAVETLLRNAFG